MASAQPAPRDSWLARAERMLHVQLAPHAAGEGCGPCPRCGTGTDRFVVFEEGNFWCRRCNYSGWWLADASEARQQAAVSRLYKQLRAQAAKETMRSSREWFTYHTQLLSEGARLEELVAAGITERCVRRFGLGLCGAAPLYRESASLTFPVFIDGRLYDIRHRLLAPPAIGGKYRSHLAGIRPAPFNLDAASESEVVLVVEGEKKAAILADNGIVAIGIPGQTFAQSGATDIAARMSALQTAVVGLDPDALPAAHLAVRAFRSAGIPALLADFPMKPDDLLLQYGVKAVNSVLRQARRV